MPFTPLHAGPGVLFKSVLGKRFNFKLFMVVQVSFDIEPAIVMFTGLLGGLHQYSHTPPATLLVTGLATGLAMLLKVPAWTAIISSVLASLSHMWLDAIYHADVAQAVAKWGIEVNRGYDAEVICIVAGSLGLLLAGIRKAIHDRFSDGVGGPARQFYGLFGRKP